jgi:hypothetical protein
MVGMENVVVDTVSELEAAISAARKSVENDLWSCSGSQVGELLGQAHRLRAQVESLELHLVREVIDRGIPAEVGAVDPRAYLIGALTMSPAEATITVKLAEALGGRLVDTGAALAAGEICRDRARAIVDMATGLPPTASPEQQAGPAPAEQGHGGLPRPGRRGAPRGCRAAEALCAPAAQWRRNPDFAVDRYR